MTRDTFCAYVVTRRDGHAIGSIETRRVEELPPGDVLIETRYSSLNYKDALSASGAAGVTRHYPHVPGIDAAGVVLDSTAARFRPGDEVIVTGYDFGATRWGGYAQLARVPSEWLVPLPAGITLREAMIFGTAGFTAAQCVSALVAHSIEPSRGPIVVTGASGGVGVLAVAVLAKLGYAVTAVSGKPAAESLLTKLGAQQIIGRDRVDDRSDKPLLPGVWAGAVDTVGDNTLATLVRATHPRGCVTACGLVGGTTLPLTVLPFILRGVTLVGIDSAQCPYDERIEIWRRLASEWKPTGLEYLAQEIRPNQLNERIERMLAGQSMGRLVVETRFDE